MESWLLTNSKRLLITKGRGIELSEHLSCLNCLNCLSTLPYIRAEIEQRRRRRMPNCHNLHPPRPSRPPPNNFGTHRSAFHVRLYNMDLATLSTHIMANPSLQSIPFDRLLLFLATTAAIKNNIALILPSDHSLAASPDVLPRSAQSFLADACGLSVDTIIQCWSAFKDIIWCSDQTRALLQAPPSTFHKHGIPHGFSMVYIC
jgi:hypothetical protein